LLAGAEINATVLVTNRGNTVLPGVIANSTALNVSGCSGDIPVGGNITCTAVYIVTAADLETSNLEFRVEATSDAAETIVKAHDSATVVLLSSPQLFVDVQGHMCSLASSGETLEECMFPHRLCEYQLWLGTDIKPLLLADRQPAVWACKLHAWLLMRTWGCALRIVCWRRCRSHLSCAGQECWQSNAAQHFSSRQQHLLQCHRLGTRP
jgi:hypothetical protein